MKHWGKGFSPHLMRNSSLNMALPSHMQAHAWRHAHTNTQAHTHTASPPPRHPCWHFGEKYPLPPPFICPHSTSPPPVAADVPRSVAYHLLPPPLTPPPSLSIFLPPNLLRLPAPSYPYDTSLDRLWAPPNRRILRFTLLIKIMHP